jgi:hypothetical protein
LPDGNGGDSGAGGRGGAISLVRRGRGDPQDDAVAVLDLEREGLAWRAMSDRDAERAAEEWMERIDDGDSQVRLILAVLTARGIKKIPRSTRSPTWSSRP